MLPGVASAVITSSANAAVVSLSAIGGAIIEYVGAVGILDATAILQLRANGDIWTQQSVGGGDVGDWITPTSEAGSAYECRMTTVSGALTSGTTGAWLALSATRAWSLTRSSSSGGISDYDGTLEIRRTSDGVVLESVSVTLQAIIE